MATTWPGCCYCYCCAFKICCLLQDLRAELQNISTQCLFLMLYAWISLELSRDMPTLNLLLLTYLLHIYLLVFEWLYYFEYQLPSTSSLCMYVFSGILHNFKIEISLIPGQMLGALFTSANIHTYWQLAVAIKRYKTYITCTTYIFTIIRIYYIYILFFNCYYLLF